MVPLKGIDCHLLVLCMVIGGCGLLEVKKEVSLPDGNYTVTGPFCISDYAKPQYTGDTTAGLRKQESFGDLTGAILTATVSDTTITKVWARHDAVAPKVGTQYDCEIHWTGTVASNKKVEKSDKKKEFQEGPGHEVQWVPDACLMEVHSTNTTPADGITDNGMYASKALTKHFVTVAPGTVADILWKVEHDGDVYRLTMSDADAEKQTGYTCSSGLALYYLWIKS